MKNCFLGLLLLCGTSANAAIVGYAGGATQPGIYAIDATSGNASFLTSVQRQLATGGMAYLNGVFYATNYTADPGRVPPNTYGEIDIATGSFTPRGTQTSANWYGLTANEAEGVLYVMDIESPVLRKVTPGGTIVEIGTGLGIDIPNGIRGMAYDDSHGILYATGYYSGDPHLYTINTTNGLATDIGSLGFAYAEYGGDIPLAYDETSGTLFAADSVARFLYSVDVQIGRATSIGYIGLPMGSMVWYNESATPVPEPSSWILLITGLISVYAYGYYARRKPMGHALAQA